ncbi:MAG: cypC [Herbinix sp.]|jgi:fatty-acid peroxygenase|nr:cypC [Herbinix sp.]
MPVLEHVRKEKGLDHTLALLREGYLFIGNRAAKYKTDVFETHIMGEKAICMTGEEAAKVFYDSELFQRNGAAPMRVQKTLFGVNAIQTMDGKAHLHRKQLFLSFMSQSNYQKLTQLVKEQWEIYSNEWVRRDQIVLFDEVNEILCRAACSFAGIKLEESEVKSRAKDFNDMVDSFGKVGSDHRKGKKARTRTEDWIKNMIEAVRLGQIPVQEGTPLYAMATYQSLEGSQMDQEMAAIELINFIRPIVAISTYIIFSALSLYNFPQCKEQLIKGDPAYADWFVQEVRRFYPFGPFVGARVIKDFQWGGMDFKTGTLVLLDLYGTNHDDRLWSNPNKFDPMRFKDWKENLYSFIPQGGGDPTKTHRCPGEGIVTEVMKISINFLVKQMEYEVPEQNLIYPMNQIPTLPESRFIITNVKR